VKVTFDGSVYPEAWDVEETFGAVEGSLAGYWGATRRLTLAARVGGKQVWGRYPWFEAAFVGGSDNLRGFDRNRWAGDKSVYASAEARFGLGASGFILPARWGLLALVDTGRVWVEGEDSDTWRAGYGGGLWVRLLTINMTFYGAIVKGQGEERVKVYAGYGFAF
jgi:hemolysin activation/secretion protein